MGSRSSTPETMRRLPARIGVGKVRRAHGVRGEVLVEVESDNPRRFDAGGELYAVASEDAVRRLRIASSRPHGDGLLLSFDGVEDRDAAEALRGAELEVDRSEIPPAGDGEVYYYELVGCRCSDRAEGDLGEVVDVVEDGGGLLLIVADGEKTLPVPFVRSFIRELDVERGRLELDLPPGLVEACASGS